MNLQASFGLGWHQSLDIPIAPVHLQFCSPDRPRALITGSAVRAFLRRTIGVNLATQDTALTEKCTGVLAVLTEAPAVRNPNAIPKYTTKHKPFLTPLYKRKKLGRFPLQLRW